MLVGCQNNELTPKKPRFKSWYQQLYVGHMLIVYGLYVFKKKYIYNNDIKYYLNPLPCDNFLFDQVIMKSLCSNQPSLCL
jgi:hypothetical protein